MKAFGRLLTLLIPLLLVHARAQNNPKPSSLALPPCALRCMQTSFTKATCDPTDQACICTSEQFDEEVTLCVTSSCTVRESLTTKRISDTNCGRPIRDRTKLISGCGIGGLILAMIAFGCRMVARLPIIKGGRWGMDDWLIAASVVFMIPLSGLSVVLAELGLGKDMWHVPFDNITQILHIYFFDEFLYLSSLTLTKLSIHCFYLRIFSTKKSFRISIYIVMAMTAGYGIAFILVSIFQCNPIHAAWEHWDGESEGTCNNINMQGWTSAGFNIILDFATLFLPIRELIKLQLWRKQKIHLLLMFSVGSFVTIVSILRLKTLIVFANTHNITWDYVEMGYWSTIEIHVGIICACMPAMRALLRRVFPVLFSYTQKSALSKSATGPFQSNRDMNSRIGKDGLDSLPLVNVKIDHKYENLDYHDHHDPFGCETTVEAGRSPSR